ncbi:MAG: aldo/keto reductase [Burkholderiaceae bacterium]
MKPVPNPQLPEMPLLGLGTWMMGEKRRQQDTEVAALVAGLDAGATLIDTAEMYADGEAEAIAGEAIAGRRDGLYLVSKVLPHNAGHDDLLAACDRSRERLGVDYIDLYLLHWPGSVPLAETIGAFEVLVERGAIGRWGVSNFDVRSMQQLLATPGAETCAVNQVYYSLGERGAEFDLLPLLAEKGIAAMAYCPLDQGDLTTHPDLLPIAKRHDATCAQIALGWLIARGVTAIPKSASPKRVQENLVALNVNLSADDLAEIDEHFMPPTRASRLKIV